MTWPAPASVLRLLTHCYKGHKFDEANTFRKDDGNRRCRQCQREYMRQYMRDYSKRRSAA